MYADTGKGKARIGGSGDCSTYEWDTAAGELILSEVGGETLSLPDYRPLRYNKTDLVNSWFFCRARKMPGCRSEAEMMVGECSAAD